MSQLDASTLRRLVDLLAPLAQTPTERRTLLALALGGNHPLLNRLDFDQATESFVVEMCTRLASYGALPDGTPTLWAVLLIVREQVGSDLVAQIDALHNVIHAPSTPSLQIDPLPPAPEGKHIFISYSRADTPFVARLTSDLQAQGLSVWIDKQGLKPGTRNWENALRESIRRCQAVVLVASPSSRKSDYVQDELAIAEMYRRPVYPVWAEGEAWIDSIPMGMGKMQYIDARDHRYGVALPALIATLKSMTVDDPLPSTEAIEINPEDIVNPFKGLQAFTGDDANHFFGRDTFVNQLLERLKDMQTPNIPRLLAVIGASGSGKSSVIMAGLLPQLRKGALPHSEGWPILDRVLPGAHPLETLADKLVQAGAGRLVDIEEYLRQPNARGLHRVIESFNAPRVVLFIDQFEEVFIQTTGEDERQQFLDLITTATTEPNGKLLVILTLRADFYDHPLNYVAFGKLLADQTVAIVPMSLADLYDAVQKPAGAVGLTFDEGLVGEIVFDVRDQAGALPLLQFTLEQLYARRKGSRLALSAYRELGGVRGALRGHAEAVYNALATEGHRKMARALFLRLIEPGATEDDTLRRRASLSEFILPDPQQTAMYQEVVDQFVSARLLTADRIGETETIEVSHEALIREWDRLGIWLREARNDLRFQKKLSTDASEWVRVGNPVSYGAFYSTTVLKDAESWASRSIPSRDEAAFIAASRAEETRNKAHTQARQRLLKIQRQLAFFLLFLLAVVLGIAFVLQLRANDSLNVVNDQLGRLLTQQAGQLVSADSYRQAGNQYIDEGKYEESIAEYNRLLALDKENIDGYLQRAFAYFQTSDYQSAINDYKSVLALDPTRMDALNDIGVMLLAIGEYEHALDTFTTVRQQAPELLPAIVNSAVALTALRRFSEAIAEIDRALVVAPNDISLLNAQFAVEIVSTSTQRYFRPLTSFFAVCSNETAFLAVAPQILEAYKTLVQPQLRDCSFRSSLNTPEVSANITTRHKFLIGQEAFTVLQLSDGSFVLERSLDASRLFLYEMGLSPLIARSAAVLINDLHSRQDSLNVPDFDECTGILMSVGGRNTRETPSSTGIIKTRLPYLAQMTIHEVTREESTSRLWYRFTTNDSLAGWIWADGIGLFGPCSNGDLQSPAFPAPIENGWFVREYSEDETMTAPHLGWDFGAALGEPIYTAPIGGVVAQVIRCTKCTPEHPSTIEAGFTMGDSRVFNDPGWGYGYGNAVIIRYDRRQLPQNAQELLAKRGFQDGVVYVMFAHLSRVDVVAGQILGPSQPIGAVGNSGNTSGTHLHFEVRIANRQGNNNWTSLRSNVIDPGLLFNWARGFPASVSNVSEAGSTSTAVNPGATATAFFQIESVLNTTMTVTPVHLWATATMTPTPTLLPPQRAQIGYNDANATGWTYEGLAGERLKIHIEILTPVYRVFDPTREEQEIPILLLAPDGSKLAEGRDVYPDEIILAEMEMVTLPKTGVYQINVNGWDDHGYYLIIESSLTEPGMTAEPTP